LVLIKQRVSFIKFTSQSGMGRSESPDPAGMA
jgi:hypothetical protein